MFTLREARSDREYEIAVDLFREYASHIGFDLSFQNFEDEICKIKNHYSRPSGQLIIVYDNRKNPVGCFGIRTWEDSICELKRMYLKKEARGKGVGKMMMTKALEIGRNLNFELMRLDTLPTMVKAIKLYRYMGFYEIEGYRFNPFKDAKYFEIRLKE